MGPIGNANNLYNILLYIGKWEAQGLFSSAHPSHNERVLKAMDHMVTPEMNHHLIQPYIVEEVKRALFQMHPSKSLGSDDMSPFFFQKY